MRFSEKGGRKADVSRDSVRLFPIALLTLASAVWTPGICGAWPWSNEQKRAERQLRAGNLEQALRHYENARLRDPDNPALDYNVGNVLHMNNRLEAAAGEYSKAITRSDSDLKEMSYYNMGNTFYRMGDMNRAIESYIRALLEDPQDHDAKHNLEMALRMIQQHKEQKEKQDQEKEEKDEKEQQQKSEEQKDTVEEREVQPKEGEMSREQAERILNALNEQEKEERRELRKSKSKAKFYVEKDW